MVAQVVEVLHPPQAQRIAPVVCTGQKDNGERCRRVFMEAYLAPGSIIRKRCDRCKTVNFWTV